MSRRRIALFAMGVIGGVADVHGVPVLKDLFRRLSEDVDIVFYSFMRVDPSGIPPSIEIRQITRISLPGRLKFFMLAIRFLIDHRARKFDGIFAVSAYPTGYWAVRAANWAGLKAVVQFIALELIALPEIGAGNASKPWLWSKTKFVCDNAHKLIAVAEYQKRTALVDTAHKKKMHVLPLRIDDASFHFRPREISSPLQLIHISYYSLVKGPDILLQVFALVRKKVPCELVVVGDGFMNNPLIDRMLSDLDIRESVRFTGMLSRVEIGEYLDRAHIMVHPARFETGCAVIQEAMASGVAVCGTRVGLLDDIGDKFAVVAPPGDVTKLAEGILELVRDPARYKKMTRDAKEWIHRYGASWSAENYRKFIAAEFPGRD